MFSNSQMEENEGLVQCSFRGKGWTLDHFQLDPGEEINRKGLLALSLDKKNTLWGHWGDSEMEGEAVQCERTMSALHMLKIKI